jgi:hypothetical protein
MRFLSTLLVLAATLTSFTASAAKTPFSPEEEKRFYQIENPASGSTTGIKMSTGAILVGNSSGKAGLITPTANTPYGVVKTAKATYDFSTMGGTIGAISLGVALPANATIIRSWTYTVTQVAGASSTMALSCETANNIYSAADRTGIAAGAYTEGVSTGAASLFKSITAACNITATIAVANVTAGKFNVYVQYVVHD